MRFRRPRFGCDEDTEVDVLRGVVVGVVLVAEF
ncbi:MAG: hypothetical protein J07HQX50_02617 [Haloquadratum sp. J07HQX50]|nr:MAG: hypothetical protein J07HQX50_02617 [Haloquadratum sp. J07HQX50]